MTTADIDNALVGAWRAQLTFTGGPRQGTNEQVSLTFLPYRVIIHADQLPADNGQTPRGIGEWTAYETAFSYWFNVVLNDPKGPPRIVVCVHGDGTLAPDGRTFTASGGSEVYSSSGGLLAINHADLVATREEAP